MKNMSALEHSNLGQSAEDLVANSALGGLIFIVFLVVDLSGVLSQHFSLLTGELSLSVIDVYWVKIWVRFIVVCILRRRLVLSQDNWISSRDYVVLNSWDMVRISGSDWLLAVREGGTDRDFISVWSLSILEPFLTNPVSFDNFVSEIDD
jgi:hypothetical protein